MPHIYWIARTIDAFPRKRQETKHMDRKRREAQPACRVSNYNYLARSFQAESAIYSSPPVSHDLRDLTVLCALTGGFRQSYRY
ncbi:hypothetical protein Csa_022018 [Cucumis sativus]|uniref:Uncharacterized protein n=1 Tax=Cucumis sativus TaxID=3659 RepID=A0A0A0LLL1_CUCSA|nr:hypothetical protein Csa_022018 [Cucumis sativus]